MHRSFVWLAAVAITVPALACGPDFPDTLLDDRAATLIELPEGVFALEAAELVARPTFAFKPVERADWIYGDEPPTREAIEREMLGADYDRAAQLRRGDDAARAYEAGAGLPEDARRYLAGAVAFAHDANEDALRRFESVLALPAGERARYGVWAAYMVGRIESFDDAPKAEAAFANVRALVAAGAADPLGLAVDSYGEEARLHLDAGDDAGAVRLYAEQAALGSRFGAASLLEVARAITRDPERLRRAVDQPMTQTLVTLYLLTRSDELDGIERSDAAAAPSPIKAYLDAAQSRARDVVEGAGRLAALAYRTGRYALATELAAKGDDGYAAWVRAKLALRNGDAAAAARAYGEAAKRFPVADVTQPAWDVWSAAPGAYCRVEGEAGTLALARGEYVAALEHLFAASPAYWMDAAFVADRVLTLDELVAFAQRAVPAPIASAAPDAEVRDSTRRAMSLRALVARRLLRAERYDEALAYFDDPARRQLASDYVAARRATSSGGRIERAAAWWSAAKLAREHGMELLGYELDPDDAMYDGAFQSYTTFGYGPVAAETGTEPEPEAAPSRPPLAIKLDPGPSAGERERVGRSVAVPDERFHYRYVAVDFASRAADLVPNRSQAYAAMLCEATGWILFRNPDAARVLYARYVANGPYVPWADAFGTQCEAPNFESAAKRLRFERVREAKRIARRALPFVAIAGVVAIGAGVFRWRRRKTRAA